MKISDFPKKDLPPTTYKYSNDKSENSEKYYYGIGVPIDYVKARYLAFREMKNSNLGGAVSGADVLMMLYANGYGVQKNLDISIWLACGNVSSSGAEFKYRAAHLKYLKDTRKDTVFDICDDITSGLMEGLCASIQLDIHEANRSKRLDSLLSKWPQKDTVAFSMLNQKATDFIYTRAQNEVDESGTGRAAFEDEEFDNLEDAFLNEVILASNCQFEGYTYDQYKKSDSILNTTYKQVMSIPDSNTSWEWGTVTKEQIRKTERVWILYRDAWVKFSKTRCPEIDENSIKALFTEERIDELMSFIRGSDK